MVQEYADKMANEMIQLLNQIESDRLSYTEERDLLRKTKDRMEKVTVRHLRSHLLPLEIVHCRPRWKSPRRRRSW